MPANCVLLLGAGFSKNWGGRLAREVTADLHSRLKDNAFISGLLARSNFEDVLGHLQAEYLHSRSSESQSHLAQMQQPLSAVFERMNEVFENRTLEFSNEAGLPLQRFLTRFDAIFTLNQDMLLEIHYRNESIAIWNWGQWNGYHMPGLRALPSQEVLSRRSRKWRPEEPFSVQSNMQPYFKLRGSSGWQSEDGEQLLVIGRDKVAAINRHPILKWNYSQFEEYLARPNTRLMVIGYGFGDEHINQFITGAHQKGSLGIMYLVHPAGKDVLEKHPNAMIKVPQPLQAIPCIESRTSLKETFSTDLMERELLEGVF